MTLLSVLMSDFGFVLITTTPFIVWLTISCMRERNKMARVTESFASLQEYPSRDICCYLKYPCAYCERKFFMVSPTTFLAGGVIQREVLERDIDTGEITKVGRRYVCHKSSSKESYFSFK